MKKLTAWAAIIAVPTAITGYFGQNVLYPGYGQCHVVKPLAHVPTGRRGALGTWRAARD